MALSVHAWRRVRLGFHPGSGARRYAVAGEAAQVDAVGESQRLLLRAGSRHRAVPDGQGVCEADLESRLRRDGPSDQESRVLAEADGRDRGLTWHAGWHQLVPAVIQPAHGIFLYPDLG